VWLSPRSCFWTRQRVFEIRFDEAGRQGKKKDREILAIDWRSARLPVAVDRCGRDQDADAQRRLRE